MDIIVLLSVLLFITIIVWIVLYFHFQKWFDMEETKRIAIAKGLSQELVFTSDLNKGRRRSHEVIWVYHSKSD